MDISKIGSAFDAYEIKSDGITIHYKRPDTPEIVNVEIEASAYMQVEREVATARREILIEVLASYKDGYGVDDLGDFDDDEWADFHKTVFAPALSEKMPHITLESVDDLAPVIRFIVDHVDAVDGLKNGDKPADWADLDRSTKTAVISNLSLGHIRDLFREIREAGSLPLDGGRGSEATSK